MNPETEKETEGKEQKYYVDIIINKCDSFETKKDLIN